MPWGGKREGAGRKPKFAAMQPPGVQSLAPAAKPAAKRAKASPSQAAKALTSKGVKTAEAGASWPFGVAAPTPAAESAPATAVKPSEKMPLDVLLELMRDETNDPAFRMEAAKIAAPFCHAKPAPQGKKAAQKEAAGKVASRFAAGAPPKLVAAGGKQV